MRLRWGVCLLALLLSATACGGLPVGVVTGQAAPPCVRPGVDRQNLQIAVTVSLSQGKRTFATETVFSPSYKYRLVVRPGTYWLSQEGVHIKRVTVGAAGTARPVLRTFCP